MRVRVRVRVGVRVKARADPMMTLASPPNRLGLGLHTFGVRRFGVKG